MPPSLRVPALLRISLQNSIGQLLSPSLHDAQRAVLPLPKRDAWHGSGDPERCARGELPFRDCLIRGALPLRDGAGPGAHDVLPLCDDALPLAWT